MSVRELGRIGIMACFHWNGKRKELKQLITYVINALCSDMNSTLRSSKR